MPEKHDSNYWTQLPNYNYEEKETFQRFPCPTKQFFKLFGEGGLLEIDKELKRLGEERKKECGNATMKRGISSSQIFQHKENALIYCFDGLILKECNYAFSENISFGDYTVMLLAEFTRKKINKAFEKHIFHLEAQQRTIRCNQIKEYFDQKTRQGSAQIKQKIHEKLALETQQRADLIKRLKEYRSRKT